MQLQFVVIPQKAQSWIWFKHNIDQVQPLKDKGIQNGFLHFWAGCCKYNMFADFIETFWGGRYGGSFPTSCSM
jgi:hypothetical protein